MVNRKQKKNYQKKLKPNKKEQKGAKKSINRTPLKNDEASKEDEEEDSYDQDSDEQIYYDQSHSFSQGRGKYDDECTNSSRQTRSKSKTITSNPLSEANEASLGAQKQSLRKTKSYGKIKSANEHKGEKQKEESVDKEDSDYVEESNTQAQYLQYQKKVQQSLPAKNNFLNEKNDSLLIDYEHFQKQNSKGISAYGNKKGRKRAFEIDHLLPLGDKEIMEEIYCFLLQYEYFANEYKEYHQREEEQSINKQFQNQLFTQPKQEHSINDFLLSLLKEENEPNIIQPHKDQEHLEKSQNAGLQSGIQTQSVEYSKYLQLDSRNNYQDFSSYNNYERSSKNQSFQHLNQNPNYYYANKSKMQPELNIMQYDEVYQYPNHSQNHENQVQLNGISYDKNYFYKNQLDEFEPTNNNYFSFPNPNGAQQMLQKVDDPFKNTIFNNSQNLEQGTINEELQNVTESQKQFLDNSHQQFREKNQFNTQILNHQRIQNSILEATPSIFNQSSIQENNSQHTNTILAEYLSKHQFKVEKLEEEEFQQEDKSLPKNDMSKIIMTPNLIILQQLEQKLQIQKQQPNYKKKTKQSRSYKLVEDFKMIYIMSEKYKNINGYSSKYWSYVVDQNLIKRPHESLRDRYKRFLKYLNRDNIIDIISWIRKHNSIEGFLNFQKINQSKFKIFLNVSVEDQNASKKPKSVNPKNRKYLSKESKSKSCDITSEDSQLKKEEEQEMEIQNEQNNSPNIVKKTIRKVCNIPLIEPQVKKGRLRKNFKDMSAESNKSSSKDTLHHQSIEQLQKNLSTKRITRSNNKVGNKIDIIQLEEDTNLPVSEENSQNIKIETKQEVDQSDRILNHLNCNFKQLSISQSEEDIMGQRPNQSYQGGILNQSSFLDQRGQVHEIESKSNSNEILNQEQYLKSSNKGYNESVPNQSPQIPQYYSYNNTLTKVEAYQQDPNNFNPILPKDILDNSSLQNNVLLKKEEEDEVSMLSLNDMYNTYTSSIKSQRHFQNDEQIKEFDLHHQKLRELEEQINSKNFPEVDYLNQCDYSNKCFDSNSFQQQYNNDPYAIDDQNNLQYKEVQEMEIERDQYQI